MTRDKTSVLEIDRRRFNSSIDHLGLHGIDFSDRNEAREFLGDIDQAMESLNGHRANLGALQNCLQSSIQNSQIYAENLSQAKSRILDVDVAAASAELAQAQILSSAATSILAQANQNPQTALKLL